MKAYILKLFVVILSSTLFACDTKEDVSEFDRQPILVNLSDTLIMPAYEAVIDQAKDFNMALESFESAPSQAQLVMLQDKWLSLALAWKTAEVYNFGPIQDLFIASSIDYFPVDTSGIQNVISSYQEKANYLTSQGSNKKGIAAIEYILFTEEEALLQTSLNKNHIAYLKLLTADIIQKIQKVIDAWASGYRDKFILSTGNAANSGLTLVSNQMIFLAEKVKNSKLGVPMAKIGGNIPAPHKVEAPYSHKSLQLLRRNIASLKSTFNGGEGSGFDNYLNALAIKDADGKLLSDKINQQFNAVITAADTIDTNLYKAVEHKHASLDHLYLEMLNLTIILKNDMMSQLGLLAIFSDNDGD